MPRLLCSLWVISQCFLGHNWGLDLCGGVPGDLPREVVRDAIAKSVSSHINALDSRLRDPTQELAGHEWRLVPVGSCLGVDTGEPLAVDYSCFNRPSNSYSVEDFGMARRLILVMFSSRWPPNLKTLPPVLGWPSLVMSMR